MGGCAPETCWDSDIQEIKYCKVASSWYFIYKFNGFISFSIFSVKPVKLHHSISGGTLMNTAY
jgi:hypothetical protein